MDLRLLIESESDSISHSVLSDSLWPHGLQPTRLLSPWNSPGKKTGVGCHFLLQRIFLTQDRTCVSCIGMKILYHWATRESLKTISIPINHHLPIWLQYSYILSGCKVSNCPWDFPAFPHLIYYQIVPFLPLKGIYVCTHLHTISPKPWSWPSGSSTFTS